MPVNAKFSQSASFITDVDVLWVIDTSGSMAPRQAGLASQVGSFVSKLNSTRLNYQMAVTTMDMSSSGERGRFLAQAGSLDAKDRAIDTRVARLRRKLDTDAIVTVRGHGYMFVPPFDKAP